MTDISKKVSRAAFIINDGTLNGYGKVPVQSGWDMDARECRLPDSLKPTGLTLGTDQNSSYDVFIKRKFLKQSSGKIGFWHSFYLFFGESFHISVNDTQSGVCALDISAQNGFFTLNQKPLPVEAVSGKYIICGTIDLDRKQAEIFINNISCGIHPIPAASADLVKISLDSHSETAIAPHSFHMWIDHIFCKKFFNSSKTNMENGWTFSADNGECFEEADINILCHDGNAALLQRKFDSKYRAAELEIKYLAEKSGGKLCISLTNGSYSAAGIIDDGKSLKSGEGLLRSHSENVWQTLRLLCDTESRTAKAFLNGKDCGYIECSDAADFIDGISVSYSHPDGGNVKLCGIAVSELYDIPDDYVPEPVLPVKKDYIVGINTCSLWRNGNHRGWDVITPFEENKTYMGYYDEGIPEQSDWEIKWMSEHGIDFEFFCWFNTRDSLPIKKNAHSAALVDGYLNARYKKYLKFAIIWEAAGGNPTSISDFREKIVPYWIDYFFTDESYMTIDNKLLIAVYGAGALVRDFGSAQEVRNQFEYVNSRVKELGFDGALFVSCSQPTETAKECGFEAVYAYNWNERGCCPDYTKTMISAQRNSGIMHVIPTVSTGFNGVAWDHRRAELLSCDNMRKLFTWIKNDILPKNNGDNWKRKLVMLSTWNEYGEGTYMCPSELCGFGYLDEIRDAFTEGGTHKDLIPTEKQKARLCYLYPQNRSILKALQKHKKTYPDEYVSSVDISKDKIIPSDGTELRYENGVIFGESRELDPQLFIENLNISAETVKNIRIRMRGSTPNGYSDIIALYFKTENDSAWSESRCVKCPTTPDCISDCNLYADELETWQGKITAIRIDPISTTGFFDIESISLMADSKSLLLKIDGKPCKTSVEIMETDGILYLPFEQYKAYGDLKIYSEWHKSDSTLYIVYRDKHMYFTAGKDSFTVNGKAVSLSAPVFMCDGLPMLDIFAFCDACDLKCTRNGRFIEISERQPSESI